MNAWPAGTGSAPPFLGGSDPALHLAEQRVGDIAAPLVLLRRHIRHLTRSPRANFAGGSARTDRGPSIFATCGCRQRAGRLTIAAAIKTAV